MPIHARFDQARWTREFTLERARAEAAVRAREHAAAWRRRRWWRRLGLGSRPSVAQIARNMGPRGEYIDGPGSMAITELARREAGEAERLGRAVPVDMLVWGRGEPANRAATKIGGLPYRPADAPWPRGQGGRPSVFMGQFCFADSLDVLGAWHGAKPRLPADVLLLFSPTEEGPMGDEFYDIGVQHEWWPLGLDNLVGPGGVPEQRWKLNRGGRLEPCYAELHRTHDYPEVPEAHPLRGYPDGERLCVLEGGKIGGVPHFAQDSETQRPGVYLCTLGSLNPAGPRYPLLNVPANAPGSVFLEGDFLMLVDNGSLYLWVEERGEGVELHWDVQYY
ncbi:MAG TPA: hypothetical protein VFF69_08305 [Phycisphaerales bacterium]|nr:hypothetical protein [Phycisphaerales bacterium]